MSYLVPGQTTTAIWSGNFLVFYRDLGGQLVRHWKGPYYLFWFVLFCFGATVVYITPTKLRKFYLQFLSALLLDLLIRILSAPNKILCVPLVTTTILHTIMYQLQGY